MRCPRRDVPVQTDPYAPMSWRPVGRPRRCRVGWAASVATIPTRSAEKSPAEDDLVEQGQRFHASAEERPSRIVAGNVSGVLHSFEHKRPQKVATVR